MEILFAAISILLDSLKNLSTASSNSRSKKKREVGKLLANWVVNIDQIINGAKSLIESLEKILILISTKKKSKQLESQVEIFKSLLHDQYYRIIDFANNINFQRIYLKNKVRFPKGTNNVTNAFKVINVYTEKHGYLEDISKAKILALLGIHYFLERLTDSDAPRALTILFYKPYNPFPVDEAYEIFPNYFSIPVELSNDEADKVARAYYDKFVSSMEIGISKGWFKKIEINITNKNDRINFIKTLKKQVELMEEVRDEIKSVLREKFEVDEII